MDLQCYDILIPLWEKSIHQETQITGEYHTLAKPKMVVVCGGGGSDTSLNFELENLR